MSNRVTILQISDLHRDPRNPIRNDALLTSLENDLRRHAAEAPPIPPPDIIIVGGDVIQGATPGTANFEQILADQHAEALDFLERLADRLVGGRRDRVVIVPGNHDVSACHTMRCLQRVDIVPDRQPHFVQQLFSPESPMRWSWPDFTLYRIEDETRYRERMAPFAEFYAQFYGGSRWFELDPAKQFDVFVFPDYDLVIAAFSSCHTNDILNKQGAIHPGCIASVGAVLRDPHYSGRLRLAVWHHNTEGPPMQSDYMNPGVLQNLIDGGFSLGFHGHQHRPQFLDSRFQYGGDARITVISSGTLCGSASYRYGRAYNVVELDLDSRCGRLHVREMQNDDLQLPIWGRRSLPPATTTHLDFRFDSAPVPLALAHPPTDTLLDAQKLMEAGKPADAANLLERLADEDGLARRLLLDCLGATHNTAKIAERFDPPLSDVEALYLMDALWSEKRHERLAALIVEPPVANSVETAVVELRNKYAARLRK